MTTADLNALLAQVVLAAGESKCKGQPGVAYKEVTWGCDDGYEVVDGAATIIPCSVCRGTGRPPLAQAVWEGMSTECPGDTSEMLSGEAIMAVWESGGTFDHTDFCCRGTGGVPIVIPTLWPEQWARDAVCGGIEGIPRTVKGEVSLETDALLVKAYTLVLHGNAPGALRALLAAVKGEAGECP